MRRAQEPDPALRHPVQLVDRFLVSPQSGEHVAEQLARAEYRGMARNDALVPDHRQLRVHVTLLPVGPASRPGYPEGPGRHSGFPPREVLVTGSV
ncbi:hypothetical protein [Streptomyces hydrogenans]|uniref:hypothetical protein n=1 Tax=Streptomyces hydrogenans TaxID=1873719 RepID=UPI00381D4D88